MSVHVRGATRLLTTWGRLIWGCAREGCVKSNWMRRSGRGKVGRWVSIVDGDTDFRVSRIYALKKEVMRCVKNEWITRCFAFCFCSMIRKNGGRVAIRRHKTTKRRPARRGKTNASLKRHSSKERGVAKE